MLAVRQTETQKSQPVVRGSSTVKTPPINERDSLLLLATDRFCSSKEADRLTVDQYKEAFYSLAYIATESTMISVSKKLSSNVFTPREVMLYLAHENITIAEPMLTDARQLSQLDMMRLIEQHDLRHSRALATRTDLGPTITKQLQRLDDDQINDNLNANMVKETETEEVTVIEAQGSETAVSQEATVAQKPARNITVSITRKTPEPETQAVSPEQSLLEAAARGGRLPSEKIANEKQSKASRLLSNLTNEQFAAGMEQLALSRDKQGISVLMQKRFNLAHETCRQVLEDQSGDTLGVLLKVADITPELANRISMLTFPAIGLSVNEALRAIRFYENLETESCVVAVEQWPKLASQKAEYQTYLAETEQDRRRAERINTSTTTSDQANYRDGIAKTG